MSVFLVIGFRSLNSQPECLYCGSDGVKANQVGADAREGGQFARLGKLVNPSWTPLPPIPSKQASASAEAETLSAQPKRKITK